MECHKTFHDTFHDSTKVYMTRSAGCRSSLPHKPHRLGCAAASPVLAPTRLARSHDSKVPLDHRFNLADTVSAVADDVFLLVLPPDSQGKVGDSAPLWSPLANEKLRVLSL